MSLGKKSLNDKKHFLYREEHEHKQHAKKDTKHFCKGKPGKEHKLTVKSYSEVKHQEGSLKAYTQNWYVQYCLECGKEMNTYIPLIVGENVEPDWLKEFKNEGKV